MKPRAHLWLLAVTAILLNACHTMRPVQPSALTAGAVGAVWVTKTDHSTVILQAPRVTGDTLEGFVDGSFHEMLLSQTTKLAVQQPARGRTVAIGVAVGVSALATFIYMANRSDVGDGQTCYTPKDGDVVPCCAGKGTISC